MKLLWITNILMPPVCQHLGLPIPVVGGWMYSSAQSLIEGENCIELSIASLYHGKELKKIMIDNITYYLLPCQGNYVKYHKSLENYWRQIDLDFSPDLVHIHGTEYPHSLAYLKVCKNRRTVISIQGLVSEISDYYNSGISNKDILLNITIRDLLKLDTLWNTKYSFYKRGVYEKEIIRRVENVIGRTTWDQSKIWALNPKATYHFCNETLRNSFYVNQWSYKNCQAHSIFLSQASYPIKGMHQLLKAMPLILRHYPDTQVYVAGSNFIQTSNLKQKIKLSGYGKYIKYLVSKYNLTNHIHFLGQLNEEEMCKRYLSSNLFLCPSSIENSPNSLGEAQLLGMPCVASFVGGIPDMMKGFEQWLYRFEEFEMMAMKICQIFELGCKIEFDRTIALHRHNKKINSSNLIEIYRKIINV